MPQSILFPPPPPARRTEPVGIEAVAVAIVVAIVVAAVIIVVDPGSSIDTKYPHSVHDRKFCHYLNNPQNNICCAYGIGIFGKMTGRITQNGRNDEQGPFDVEDFRPAFQLLP